MRQALTMALGFLIGGLPPVAGPAQAQALQDGDLVVGAGIARPFGVISGVIKRVSGGSVTTFCQSPAAASDPNFWNIPREVIADSQGRAVFLAYMGAFFGGFDDWGLFRCDTEGATPELLAFFPSSAASDIAGRPFPGEYFETFSGLHLARVNSVVIDDDANGGLPQAIVEDAYVFAAATWNPDAPPQPQRTDLKSLRYRAGTGEWEEGVPGSIKLDGPKGTGSIMPDMTNSKGETYVVVHPGNRPAPDGRPQADIIRRISDPLRLDAMGNVGGVPFSLQVSVFGGERDIGGGVSQGAFAEIAATSFLLDDLSVPNPAGGCDPNLLPQIDHSVPLVNGGYFHPFGLEQIVVDPTDGLVVGTNAGATGTPFLTQIDQAGLNDDPLDDASQLFLRPELGCIPQRSIKFESILPISDPGGTGGNVVAQLVSTANGMFGTQPFDHEVVRVVQGDKVLTVAGAASGLLFPVGIGAFPPTAGEAAGLVLVVRIDSPVSVLVTDAAGRRIGADENGQPINDFGTDGFDSGLGEPRIYAIRNPSPGTYLVDVVGMANGNYTVHVYSADLSQTQGMHIAASDTAFQGSSAAHDFSLAADGSIAFLAAPMPGDLDGDGDVDRDDINLILAARNQPASGADDPRDLDGDGMITALDARIAVTLCTRPRCATS